MGNRMHLPAIDRKFILIFRLCALLDTQSAGIETQVCANLRPSDELADRFCEAKSSEAWQDDSEP
jgi:hypothetical protein